MVKPRVLHWEVSYVPSFTDRDGHARGGGDAAVGDLHAMQARVSRQLRPKNLNRGHPAPEDVDDDIGIETDPGQRPGPARPSARRRGSGKLEALVEWSFEGFRGRFGSRSEA